MERTRFLRILPDAQCNVSRFPQHETLTAGAWAGSADSAALDSGMKLLLLCLDLMCVVCDYSLLSA